ncbi:MAG: methyltransferase domain-containing protein [Bryobacteraceae bacterium]
MAIQEVHFTGERVIPGEVNQDLWNEHYSRYRFAATFAAEKRVLDVGCGAGYGTALLAESAANAIGFDVSAEAIEYARRHYGQKARFVVGDAAHFPEDLHGFDVITAFEVIEHLEGYENLIAEAARVLTDGGIFLVSTPNKIYYTETRREAGPNPYHVHEFEFAEFDAVLRRRFPHVQVIAQNLQEAVVFGGAASMVGSSYIAAAPSLRKAQFFIALCSNRPLTAPAFAYVAEAGNLLRDREHHVRLLQDEVAAARADHLRLLEEHERCERDLEKSNNWAESLDKELAQARQSISEFQQQAEEKTQWALELDRELRDQSTELVGVVAQLDDMQRTLRDRTEWAKAQEALCLERTRWAQQQETAVQSQGRLIQELQEAVEERTAWAQRLDGELAEAHSVIEERTAWAQRLDVELAEHSNVGQTMRSELAVLLERAAEFGVLSAQLSDENQRLREQLVSFDETRARLASIGEKADRLAHERELVRTSKWLKLGHLLHVGPRLYEDTPPL